MNKIGQLEASGSYGSLLEYDQLRLTQKVKDAFVGFSECRRTHNELVNTACRYTNPSQNDANIIVIGYLKKVVHKCHCVTVKLLKFECLHRVHFCIYILVTVRKYFKLLDFLDVTKHVL